MFDNLALIQIYLLIVGSLHKCSYTSSARESFFRAQGPPGAALKWVGL